MNLPIGLKVAMLTSMQAPQACRDRSDTKVFTRRPAQSFALMEELPNRELVKDRIRELPVPLSIELRSLTLNFMSAAVKVGQKQWGIFNIDNQLQAWNHRPVIPGLNHDRFARVVKVSERR